MKQYDWCSEDVRFTATRAPFPFVITDFFRTLLIDRIRLTGMPQGNNTMA